MVSPTPPALLPVSAVSADEVVRVDPATSLVDLASVMATQTVSALVVGLDDEPVGIVTEHDVVRAVAAGSDPTLVTAADIAETDLLWAQPDSTVVEVAEEMMERWVRHVLVGVGGRLSGIVSARDLLGVFLAAVEVDLDEVDGD